VTTYEKEEKIYLELMDRAIPSATCAFEPKEGKASSASKG
jgi:hypothetical protein